MGNEVTYEQTTQLTELTAPFGQNIKLEQVLPADGVHMMRVRIQERSRFTVFDIDPVVADAWGRAMVDWASSTDTIDSDNGADD